MDSTMETSTERIRRHLRRTLASTRNLLINDAGNTVSDTGPH